MEEREETEEAEAEELIYLAGARSWGRGVMSRCELSPVRKAELAS